VRRGDLEGFANAARAKSSYVPLAQGAIDVALQGVTSVAEAMAVGGGLEEPDEAPGALSEALLDDLLAEGA
jgi:hypothetical protein